MVNDEPFFQAFTALSPTSKYRVLGGLAASSQSDQQGSCRSRLLCKRNAIDYDELSDESSGSRE